MNKKRGIILLVFIIFGIAIIIILSTVFISLWLFTETVNPCSDSKEPEEVFQCFVSALEKNDLTETLKYIHPDSRQLYEDVFSGNSELTEEFRGFSFSESLSSLTEKLNGKSLTLIEEFGDFRDYSYPCADQEGNIWECIIRFKKDEDGLWKIKNF